MILRDSIKNQIYDALNYDIFRFEDFTITVEESPSTYICLLNISYDQYYLKISFKNQVFKLAFSPGDLLLEEEEEMTSSAFMRGYREYIHAWLGRVKNDILHPVKKRFVDDKISEFKKEMEDKLSEMEDGYFTKEEGSALKERLEQLENMIAGRESLEEMQAEISKMKAEIAFLKATVDTLTKKKWFRNALVKMWTWGQKEENRKLIESGIEVVKSISQIDIPL